MAPSAAPSSAFVAPLSAPAGRANADGAEARRPRVNVAATSFTSGAGPAAAGRASEQPPPPLPRASAARAAVTTEPGPYGATDEWPAVLLRHVGVWEGTFRRLDPNAPAVVDEHRARLEIGVRGRRWAQRNTYWWPDGRDAVFEFPGFLRNGHHVIESPRANGYTVPINASTVAFYCERPGTDETVTEIIRLLSDTARSRTWQIVRAGRVVELMQIEEVKTSSENVFFEIPAAPPS